jgi:hypothetical protein
MGRVRRMHPLGAIVEGCHDAVLEAVSFGYVLTVCNLRICMEFAKF